MVADALPKHPATYSAELIPVLRDELAKVAKDLVDRPVLDPFAGTGGIGEVVRINEGQPPVALDIEKEWLDQAPVHVVTMQRDARRTGLRGNWFRAVITSPTYGNRMADSFAQSESNGSRYITYTHYLGHELSPGNSGILQFGPAYRLFHRQAWTEAYRVLAPGGRLILNIADHIRDGQRVQVALAHHWILEEVGFKHLHTIEVETPGMRYGANREARLGHELVAVYRKPRSGDAPAPPEFWERT